MMISCLHTLAAELNAQLTGSNVTFSGCATDTRQPMHGALFIALRGENFDGHKFLDAAQAQGAVAALVDRPVSTSLPTLSVGDTRHALGNIAAYWRQQHTAPIVAVTGSNGKTTVKEMLFAILSQRGDTLATQGNLNNDLGLPLTLCELEPQHEYVVVEMGANHVGEINYLTHIAEPDIAIITQCAPAHLEGFGSIEAVARTKGEIFSGLSAQGTAVINADDSYYELWKTLATPHTILRFALQAEADIYATDITMHETGSNFTLNTPQGSIPISLNVLGEHNIMNALAASAAAVACNTPLELIQTGLASMNAVKGRLNAKKGKHQSIVLDDTYNANPTSLRAGLQVLQQYDHPRWLILGDMFELGEDSQQLHQDIGDYAKELGIDQVWTLGELSQASSQNWGEKGRHFTDQNQLINELLNALQQPTALLIKGSRGMRMEHVVNALCGEIN